jgi:hypothetical protein
LPFPGGEPFLAASRSRAQAVSGWQQERSALGSSISRSHTQAVLNYGARAECFLGCLVVLTRREVSKDAELLVLRHENVVLRRQISRVRYQPTDRLWLAALSRLVTRKWDYTSRRQPDHEQVDEANEHECRG